MSMTDPIADLLTRIRNACRAGHRRVDVPASRLKCEIARVLLSEHFIDNFTLLDDGKQGKLRLSLRYDEANKSIIRGVERYSRPGLRQYSTHKKMPKVLRGLGIAIVSTSKGVMTDRDARKAQVGGEVLCKVW